MVGDREVEVVEVGPAHTKGDAFVHLADARVVFTGDILFKNAHPVVWEGPVSNWITACDRIIALEPEVVVPGHGPVTDTSGLREMRDYLTLLTGEARRRYDAGMSLDECVRDILLDAWKGWLDAERVYVNVRTLYRDFSGDEETPDVLEVFAKMARYRRQEL